MLFWPGLLILILPAKVCEGLICGLYSDLLSIFFPHFSP